MSKLVLVPQTIYLAIEWNEERFVKFRYVKTNYYDGEPVYAGVDLATGNVCSLFPTMWSFQELSSLEQELY